MLQVHIHNSFQTEISASSTQHNYIIVIQSDKVQSFEY